MNTIRREVGAKEEIRIGRKEFISWLKGRANQFAKESGGFLGILAAKDKSAWKFVCSLKELADPVIVFSGKNAMYVVKQSEVVAYRAQCPVDQSLIHWSATEAGFCCPRCKRVYDLGGKAVDGREELEKWPCRVTDGQVFILVRA